jgi:hypothetical protein
MLTVEVEPGTDAQRVRTETKVAPHHAAGRWVRRVAAVLALAAIFFGVLLGRGLFSGSDSGRAGSAAVQRTMPTSSAIEAKYGVRFIAVDVTSAGGMIQIRYQVLDSAKTEAIHTQEATPTVIDGSGIEYNLPGIPGHSHIGPVKKAGTTDFVLLANAKGGVKSGTTVTIRIGDLELRGVSVN